ncbi:transglycosylase domain-containing protein [Dietzia maris]|uniref:transglycosylase domain-containing protein n=1 Tax=Dietzia maris TaxID=37915 RepID=UPI0037C83D63
MTATAYTEGPYDPDSTDTEVFNFEYVDYFGNREPEPEPEPEDWRDRLGSWLRGTSTKLKFWLLAIGALLLVFALSMPASLRWFTPESTAFMDRQPDPIHQFVTTNHISRHLFASAMVLEDAEIGERSGAFDLVTFAETAQRYIAGENVVGGSTIHQQLVKNLYLSPERSASRKAIEALISVATATFVPEDRIMELYVNFAQFGPNIYGVCAATWYYFDSPPWYVSEFQAAQLMGVLPFPSEARRAEGGGMYVVGSEAIQNSYLDRVYNRAPGGLAYRGGYQPLMDQVGIVGDASDYEHVGPDSCSTIPPAVQELLASEDAK